MCLVQLIVYLLQELQAEVRKRQAAVLRPEPGSQEEHLNAFQRQKRLRLFVAAGCTCKQVGPALKYSVTWDPAWSTVLSWNITVLSE